MLCYDSLEHKFNMLGLLTCISFIFFLFPPYDIIHHFCVFIAFTFWGFICAGMAGLALEKWTLFSNTG